MQLFQNLFTKLKSLFSVAGILEVDSIMLQYKAVGTIRDILGGTSCSETFALAGHEWSVNISIL